MKTTNKLKAKLGYGILILLFASLFAFKKEDAQFRCFPLKEEVCTIPQGEAGAVVIEFKSPPKSVAASFWHKPISFRPDPNCRRDWTGFLPADLRMAPGEYLLHITTIENSGEETEFLLPITIEEKKYVVEELTLDPEMVNLKPEALKRVVKDNQILIGAMSDFTHTLYWEGAFIAPVPGEVTSPYGMQRIINNVPKSPHNGVDLSAAEGDEIQATNTGKVSIVYEGYLTGKTVIVDHGGGLYSVYFHLSEPKVQTGDLVNKGDVIGLVGATGMVTGPHLHFSIRLGKSYIDPQSFLAVAAEAERAREKLEK